MNLLRRGVLETSLRYLTIATTIYRSRGSLAREPSCVKQRHHPLPDEDDEPCAARSASLPQPLLEAQRVDLPERLLVALPDQVRVEVRVVVVHLLFLLPF